MGTSFFLAGSYRIDFLHSCSAVIQLLISDYGTDTGISVGYHQEAVFTDKFQRIVHNPFTIWLHLGHPWISGHTKLQFYANSGIGNIDFHPQ